MGATVRIKREVLAGLLAEARRDPALECCGLLAGRDGVITELLPAPNALASATAFEIAPADLFRLFRGMRAAGLEHMGIYHSHPTGDNVPSPRDLEQAYYPDVAYFIISPQPDAPQPVRAFAIRDGGVSELQIVEV
jgi:proteasome lid subunit RPN8/RPN11